MLYFLFFKLLRLSNSEILNNNRNLDFIKFEMEIFKND